MAAGLAAGADEPALSWPGAVLRQYRPVRDGGHPPRAAHTYLLAADCAAGAGGVPGQPDRRIPASADRHTAEHIAHAACAVSLRAAGGWPGITANHAGDSFR